MGRRIKSSPVPSRAINPQGVNVSPAYRTLPLTPDDEVQEQVVRARAELCNDTSPLSFQSQTMDWFGPPLIPGFEPIFSGASQVVVTSMMNGARVTLVRNNTQVGTFPVSRGNSVFRYIRPFMMAKCFQPLKSCVPTQVPAKAGRSRCSHVRHSPRRK
jgi:hypothetical protein